MLISIQSKFMHVYLSAMKSRTTERRHSRSTSAAFSNGAFQRELLHVGEDIRSEKYAELFAFLDKNSGIRIDSVHRI